LVAGCQQLLGADAKVDARRTLTSENMRTDIRDERPSASAFFAGKKLPAKKSVEKKNI
jgi:hypothetical protein